ncbi:member 4 [Mactra antiquata]
MNKIKIWCRVLLISFGMIFCYSKSRFKEIRDYENLISNEEMLLEFTLKNDNCWRSCHGHDLSVNGCPTNRGYIFNTTANLCFKLTDFKIVDDDAEAICAADGARVAKIINKGKQTTIADYLKFIGITTSPGIDGHRNAGSTDWTGSTYFRDNQMMEFFYWGPAGEPTDTNKQCIKLDSSNDFSWTGSLCHKRHQYICEVVL